MHNKGFSLIELILVIAIMGILSSVLLPNFSKIIQKAKSQSLKQVGQTVQLALASYFMTHQVYPTGQTLSLSLLAPLLTSSQDLSTLPQNPFTGALFTPSDVSGQIYYTSDSTQYSLVGYGLHNQTALFNYSSQ